MRLANRSTWAWLMCGIAPFAMHGAAAAHGDSPEETVAVQFEQRLANVPGKTFTTLLVTFPPGSRAVPHRHGQAFVYAYVLDGAVRSGLEGELPAVFRAGENWSEAPGAHHVLTENASDTTSARLLVVFVADTGAALKVPDSR